MIYTVRISKKAAKQIRKVPSHIANHLDAWVQIVREGGLEEARKVPGYQDEPLRGERRGQRSIRLSRSYRAIYVIGAEGILEFVQVEEVSKHEY